MLSSQDRALLESAQFDPRAKPSYESVKSCLVWPDELPDGLSLEGIQFIHRLLAARSFMYRGIPRKGRREYLQAAWDEASLSGLKWSGFRRLTVSPKDLAFLENAIRQEIDTGSV